jgi:hypothetical protein
MWFLWECWSRRFVVFRRMEVTLLCLQLLYPSHRRLLSTVSMWTVFGQCYSELACSSLESVYVHCSSPLHEAKTVSLKNSYCRKLWLICLHLNSKHEGLLEFFLCSCSCAPLQCHSWISVFCSWWSSEASQWVCRNPICMHSLQVGGALMCLSMLQSWVLNTSTAAFPSAEFLPELLQLLCGMSFG